MPRPFARSHGAFGDKGGEVRRGVGCHLHRLSSRGLFDRFVRHRAMIRIVCG